MRWVFALLGIGLAVALVWAWLPEGSSEVVVAPIERATVLQDAHVVTALDAVERSAIETAEADVDLPSDSERAADDARVPIVSNAQKARSRDVLVRVLQPSGESCRDARVRWTPCDRKLALRAHPRPENHTRNTMDNGETRVPVEAMAWAPCVNMWAESSDRAFFSKPFVIEDTSDPPTDVTLVLERAGQLVVSVRAFDETALPNTSVQLVPTAPFPWVGYTTGRTDERGEVALFVARGSYDVIATDSRTLVSVQSTAVVGDRARVELIVPRAPLAVAGVVLDESEHGLANVPLTVRSTTGGGIARGGKRGHDVAVSTGPDGTFEVRMVPSGDVFVTVSSDPFIANYSPSSVSVPHGTTGVVIRREHSVAAHRLRLRVVDASTRESPRGIVLTLQLPPPVEGKRIFRSHDGHIEGDIPGRDDLTWKLDAVGCLPIEGRFVDLKPGLDGEVLELVLQQDAAEREAESERELRTREAMSRRKSKDLKRE